MKRILTTLFMACNFFAITSCLDNKVEEEQKVDFGEVGPHLELDYVNGEFVPKTAPVEQAAFNAFFQGTWTLEMIKHVSRSGKLTDVEMPTGVSYPCFGVKEGDKLREYIYDNVTLETTYKDGSYLYNPDTGVLEFIDVVETHPKFRVVTIKESEMTGTFKSTDNNYDQAVLTLYVYRRLSPLEEPHM